jgi:uncharacterized Zn finger protein (UPF0148 family)
MNDQQDDENEIRLQKNANSVGKTLLSKQETNREVSRLLLGGWKMLSESCPISEFPLFQNKTTHELWSVRLQMPVKRSSPSNDNLVETQQVEAPQLSSEIYNEISLTSSPVSASLTTNEISKRIGQKLLMGWELLQETVDGCPLMKDLTGRRWLPSEEQYIDVESMHAYTDEKFEMERGGDFDRIIPIPITEDEDAISERLSAKMLLGWQMLYEHCPSTNSCPLLLDPKSGRKWSAATNNYIDNEPHDEKSHSKAVKNVEAEVNKPAVTGNNEEDDMISKIIKKKIAQWTLDLSTETDLIRCKLLLELIREGRLTIMGFSSG